jgi:hypothetical protein
MEISIRILKTKRFGELNIKAYLNSYLYIIYSTGLSD